LPWQHNLAADQLAAAAAVCCADCQRPIAISLYPLIELLSAGLWIAMLFARARPRWQTPPDLDAAVPPAGCWSAGLLPLALDRL